MEIQYISRGYSGPLLSTLILRARRFCYAPVPSLLPRRPPGPLVSVPFEFKCHQGHSRTFPGCSPFMLVFVTLWKLDARVYPVPRDSCSVALYHGVSNAFRVSSGSEIIFLQVSGRTALRSPKGLESGIKTNGECPSPCVIPVAGKLELTLQPSWPMFFFGRHQLRGDFTRRWGSP